MPLTVQKLTGATVETTIDVKIPGQEEPEKVRLVYRPGILTPKLESELRVYGDRSEGWAALIVKLVASWDVEAAKGEPLPLEQAALETVPGWFLQAVVAGIREDLVPSPKSAETSGAGS